MENKPETTKKQPRITVFYSFARMLLWAFCGLIYPSRCYNRKVLDRDAPYIIVSNHQSMMDPIFIALRVWRYEIRFLGKSTLNKSAFVKAILHRLHMIPVARKETDIGAMRACLKSLQEGNVVGLFPEGSRHSEQDTMQEVMSGVSLLVLRSKVPLIPILITPRPKPFHFTKMIVGEPIDYSDLLEQGVNKITCEQLTLRIAEKTLALKNMLD